MYNQIFDSNSIISISFAFDFLFFILVDGRKCECVCVCALIMHCKLIFFGKQATTKNAKKNSQRYLEQNHLFLRVCCVQLKSSHWINENCGKASQKISL